MFLQFNFIASLLVSGSAFAVQPSGDILMIGDSHLCEAFGNSLVHELTAGGATVDVYCAKSTAPNHWLKGNTPKGITCKGSADGKIPSLASILAAKHYRNVIIALGTNTALSPYAGKSYSDLAKVIPPGTSCSWVGPPHFRSDQAKGYLPSRLQTMDDNLPRFYHSLRKSVGPCAVIDSRPSTNIKRRGGSTRDGVHRNSRAAQAWAAAVAKDFHQQTSCQVLQKAMDASKMTSPINGCIH